MKHLLLLGLAALSLLSACAPAAGGQTDFPVDRKVKWVLVNGDISNNRNYYWVQFDTAAPQRRDSITIVNAVAQRFGGGPAMTASFGYLPGSDFMMSYIFLEREFDSNANAINCMLFPNKDKKVTQLRPGDWYGLGKQDTPNNFSGKLDLKDKGYFDTCILVDATQFVGLHPKTQLSDAVKARLLEGAAALPANTW